MNALTALLSQGVAERLGWTLLHSLWEATLIAAALAIVLRLLAKSSAQLRYAAACAAMVAMALLPGITGGLLSLPTKGAPAAITSMSQPFTTPAPIGTELAAAAAPAVPAQASSERAREQSWREVALDTLESALPYAVGVWLAGVLFFSLRHLLAWTRVQQLRRKQVRPADASLRDRLSSLARRLGIERAVRLVESGLVRTPAVIGWLRPMILLPASAVTGLNPEQLEALLLHELAHIRRHDYLVNLVQTILEILGFYHPAVWWVSRRIRIERENCCDDVAARALGDNLRYARALASMEDLRADRPEPAMAASGGSLLARIRRLVGRSPNEGSSSTWAPVLVVGLLLLLAAVPVGLAIAEEYAGPTNELERAVLKGFAENRDKFTCGVLAWTRTTELHGDAGFPMPEGGLRSDDRYRLWWDGDKVATTYTAGIFAHSDTAPSLEDQTSQRRENGVYYWIQTLEDSELYVPGSRVQESPWLHDNWFTKVIQWRGQDSLDRRIVDERHKSGVAVEWATTDIEGNTMIRRTIKNEDSGGYNIELYDPARGYGLVRRESFTAQGKRLLSQTVRLQEAVPGAWFPVEVDTETIRAENGFTTMRRHTTLDLEQCHFNDRSALPDGIFEQPPRANQSELREVLQEIQQEQASAQTTDSTAGTQGPSAAVERFLIALVQGDREEAAKWLPRGQTHDYFQEFEGWLDDQDVREMAVIAEDQAALVVTSAIYQAGKKAGPLVFSLVRSSDDQPRWLIDSMKMQTSQGAKREIGQFFDYHPSAVMKLMPDAGKRKVVHFPTDRSVGTLYTREWDFPTDSYTTSLYWRKLGEARGDVTIPAGKALKLDVDEGAWRAGSLFNTLQPGDIQMLDFSECENANDSILASVAKLRGLRALSLAGTEVTGEGLGHLKGTPDLRWLCLASTPLNDEGAAHLADLGSLEYLNLRYTKITDAAMAHVARIRGLKWLSLDADAVGDEGMAQLKASTSLQGLSLWKCGITDDGLGHLAGLTSLTNLELVNTRITDRGLVCLAGMQRLKSLRLAVTGVMGEGLAHLRGLKSLEHVELPDNDIKDEQLAYLADLDHLKRLRIISNESTEKGFRWLASLQSPLEELETGGQGVTDDAAAAIGRSSLKSLWIQRAPLTDEGLARLTQSRAAGSLEKLRLTQVNITGPGLASLKRFPRLKELTLEDLYIGEGEFAALGDLTTLGRLTIGRDFPGSRMAFGDRDMAALANLKYLRSLAIVSNQVTDAGLRHLSGLKFLDDLSLSGQGITDAGLGYLEGLGSLKSLSLSGTRVTREGMERLQRAMPGLECRL
jgi:beta-lactamase regulating signal transducer with metallopeptidase domain/Leucine-rich repeat (LRR) protein